MNNYTNNNNILPKELENCNFVKTILMLLVVFYHSILFWNGDWLANTNPAIESKILPFISTWLNSFHIYAFTLVSGYIFYYIKFERGKYNNFKNYIISKFKRLIVPYICISIIWIIPVGIYLFKYDTPQIIDKYVLGTSPNQLWFLLMLFNIFIVVFPLANILKNKFKTSVLIVIGIYLFGVILSKYAFNYFQLRTSCRFLLFFFIGFQLRNTGFNLFKIPWYLYLIINLLLYYVLILLEPINRIGSSIIRLLLQIEGSLAAFVILQKLSNIVSWNNKVFKALSSATMNIFLFHQQVIYFTIIALNGLIPPVLHGLLNYIFTIIICYFISYCLLKFNFTRFFVGEKQL